jgi:hypothetical protein
VSRSIDDVLDNLRDFVREYDQFAIQDGAAMLPVVNAIVEAVGALRGAVVVVADAPRQVGPRALVAHKATTRCAARAMRHWPSSSAAKT